jgi:hypothetical protein
MTKAVLSVVMTVALCLGFVPGLLTDWAVAIAPPEEKGSSSADETTTAAPSGGKEIGPNDPSASKISGLLFVRRNEGWKCVGPVAVNSYDSKGLKLFYPKKVHIIPLDGKTVEVKDALGKPGSTSDLAQNKWVCVCEKESQVLIYTLPEN